MQPRIARACDRAPAVSLAIDKEHVVEAVDRLEAQHEWWVPARLENDRGGERRFHAVRVPVPHDSAEASKCAPDRRRLVVIRQLIEKSLNLPGCSEACQELGFLWRQLYLGTHIDSACVVIKRLVLSASLSSPSPPCRRSNELGGRQGLTVRRYWGDWVSWRCANSIAIRSAQ